MASDEIVEKLHRHLELHAPMSEECHAVYLIVELRKLLERDERLRSFKTFKLYADWTVHPRIDGHTGTVFDCVQAMFAEVNACFFAQPKKQPATPVLDTFLSFGALRTELRAIFSLYRFDLALCEREQNWRAFLGLFTHVIEHQPLLLNEGSVSRVEFLRHSASFQLFFRNPVNGKSEFTRSHVF